MSEPRAYEANLKELKGEIDHLTIVAEDFKNLLLILDKTIRTSVKK